MRPYLIVAIIAATAMLLPACQKDQVKPQSSNVKQPAAVPVKTSKVSTDSGSTGGGGDDDGPIIMHIDSTGVQVPL